MLDAPDLKSLSPGFAVDCQTLKDGEGYARSTRSLGARPRGQGRNGVAATRCWGLRPTPQRHREDPSARTGFRADSGEVPACLQGPQAELLILLLAPKFGVQS